MPYLKRNLHLECVTLNLIEESYINLDFYVTAEMTLDCLALLSSIILKYKLRTTAESVVVFVRARASGIVKCTTALYAVAKYCVEL